MGRKRLNLIGQKFGRLFVIEDVDNNNQGNFLRCLCDCGNETIVRGSHLISGGTKSCGCLQRERTSETHKGENSPAKRIEVRQKMSENHANVSGKNHPMFGKTHSAEARQKISEAAKLRIGENASNYKHGLARTRGYKNQKAAEREALKKNQTLDIADPIKIQLVYNFCDKLNKVGFLKYHVDHIKPLSKGGLHREDNIQILLKTLNGEKHNKWPLTEEEKIRYKGITIKDLILGGQNELRGNRKNNKRIEY